MFCICLPWFAMDFLLFVLFLNFTSFTTYSYGFKQNRKRDFLTNIICCHIAAGFARTYLWSCWVESCGAMGANKKYIFQIVWQGLFCLWLFGLEFIRSFHFPLMYFSMVDFFWDLIRTFYHLSDYWTPIIGFIRRF